MNTEKPAADKAAQIMGDARNLVAATADIADAKVTAARNRLLSALRTSREVFSAVQEKAIAGAKATDQTIRDYPYHAVGVALGVGALIGFNLARRSQNCEGGCEQ